MWFRVGYWVGLLIFGLISMAVHTGSVAAVFAIFPLAGGALLESMPNAPIWLEALVGVLLVAVFITGIVWGLNPTKGDGVMAYTPQKYLTSVVIIASVIILLMAGNGKVDMTEIEAHFSIFFISTMFPLMLFMRQRY